MVLRRDPVEGLVEDALKLYSIPYTTNVNLPQVNRRIDFHLPTIGIYIECKQFHTSRLNQQIAPLTNVVVIQGVAAAEGFARLLETVYNQGYNAG